MDRLVRFIAVARITCARWAEHEQKRERLRMRTLVTFRSSAFNTAVSKDYFINPSCFGDDVAKWMMQELRNRGLQVAEGPNQEDFGWYFTFRQDNLEYDFIVGFRPGDSTSEGDWIGWLERRRGFIGSIFGRRKVGLKPDAVNAIHAILSTAAQIQDVRWHTQADFDKGNEELGSHQP